MFILRFGIFILTVGGKNGRKGNVLMAIPKHDCKLNILKLGKSLHYNQQFINYNIALMNLNIDKEYINNSLRYKRFLEAVYFFTHAISVFGVSFN